MANSEARKGVKADSPLASILDQAQGLSPEERTSLLAESDSLQKAHEATAQQGQSAAPAADDEVNLHFVAFVRGPNGKLVELDGRRSGPIERDVDASGDLLSAATQFVQQYYMAADPNEVNFNLIAMGPGDDS